MDTLTSLLEDSRKATESLVSVENPFYHMIVTKKIKKMTFERGSSKLKAHSCFVSDWLLLTLKISFKVPLPGSSIRVERMRLLLLALGDQYRGHCVAW